MSQKVKLDQLICWWSMPIFYQFFGLIFGYLTRIMGPPIPGPNLPQEGINAFTLGNATHMQIGLVLLAISLGYASMGTGVIVVQMRRMSGPVLAYGYLACGAAAALPGCLFCGLTFAVAVFRPDRDPQIITMLYDMGFVGFIGCLGCFVTQYLVFAVAIFLDKRAIFPKWLGYMTIWNLVTELIAAPVWIFRSGPYAKAVNKQPLDEVEPVYRDSLHAGNVNV